MKSKRIAAFWGSLRIADVLKSNDEKLKKNLEPEDADLSTSNGAKLTDFLASEDFKLMLIFWHQEMQNIRGDLDLKRVVILMHIKQ